MTVRAKVDGETKEETVTVTKELPSEFYADARIQEGGETLYDTDWSTPYSFDSHIVDRQAFLDGRSERRDELADEGPLLTEDDVEQLNENIRILRDERDYSENELIEGILGNIHAGMEGVGSYEGSGAEANSFNIEKALEEHTDFNPNYVGGFVNPPEPDVPSAGDGIGIRVNSQVAYIEDDWFHNGEDNITASQINNIDEIGMVEEGTDFDDTSASELAVSVLGEFERGNTDIQNPDEAEYWVEKAVTSPVTLNGNMTELELNDDISWNALNEIRENADWDSVMIPIELAAAVGTQVDESVSLEGETLENSTIKIGQA